MKIHQSEKPAHSIYHLSSGTGSQTYKELTDAVGGARWMVKAKLPAVAGQTVFRHGELAGV